MALGWQAWVAQALKTLCGLDSRASSPGPGQAGLLGVPGVQAGEWDRRVQLGRVLEARGPLRLGTGLTLQGLCSGSGGSLAPGEGADSLQVGQRQAEALGQCVQTQVELVSQL